jgi:DNA-binding LacI/PurR family transcriptional regulator
MAPLDRTSPLPAYRQLAELLAREIRGCRHPGERIPSQNELADAHGVSVETVLKSLRDLELRGLITRERGRGTFVAPAPAAGRPARRPQALGVVISESWDRAELDPFYQEMVAALGRAASREGFSLLLLASDALRPARLPAFLRERPVAGLLVFNRPEIPGAAFRALRQAFPVVITDPPADRDDDVGWVDVDSGAGGRMAMDLLLRAGHRRIGFLNSDPVRRPAFAARLEAYRAALAGRGIPFRKDLVRQTADLSVEAARRHARALLARKPTALFCANGRLTLGALRAAAEAGLRIPGDLSIVGYDDAPVFSLTPPGITMVRQPVRRFAEALAGTLIAQVRTGRVATSGTRLAPELVERGSVAAPRTREARCVVS